MKYFIAHFPNDPKYWNIVPDLVDGVLISQKNLHTKNHRPTKLLKLMLEYGSKEVLKIPNKITLMTDSGAYQYISPEYEEIPISPEELMELYRKLQTDIGVHLDWPITPNLDRKMIRKRYKTTLENALIFKELTEKEKYRKIKIIAVTQGLTPSMHKKCAETYVKLGFKYIGIGGLVPLLRFRTKYDEVYKIIDGVLSVTKNIRKIKIHLFGVGNINILKKYEHLSEKLSFDNATPTLSAIKGDIIFFNPHYERFNIAKNKSKIKRKIPCIYCPACKKYGRNILKRGKREWNFGRAVHNYVHYKMFLNKIWEGKNEPNSRRR